MRDGMSWVRILSMASVLVSAQPAWAGVGEVVGDVGAETERAVAAEARSAVRGAARSTFGCLRNPRKCLESAKSKDEAAGAVNVSAGPPPPPSSRPGPPPPPSARTWYVDVGAGKSRAVSEAELQAMVRSGSVLLDTPVYTDSIGRWVPAREAKELHGHFAGRPQR